jgi:hypothetical protein
MVTVVSVAAGTDSVNGWEVSYPAFAGTVELRPSSTRPGEIGDVMIASTKWRIVSPTRKVR